MKRDRRLALALVFTLPSVVLLCITGVVFGKFRIDVPDRLTESERAVAMSTLRTTFETGEARAVPSGQLERSLPERGPVVVSVFEQGLQVARVFGYGDTVAAAVSAAATELAADKIVNLDAERRARSRIKVDIVIGRGPFADSAVLKLLALHPGLEGMGVTLDGERELVLLPDDLVAHKLLTSQMPLKFIPDLKIGFDFERAEMTLAVLAKLPPGAYGTAKKTYWRFRIDSFVERAEPLAGAPLALYRGIPDAPKVTAETLRAAAIEGGRYLVAHLAENGRYIYERDLVTGIGTDPRRRFPYSMPRHAGTTYFLAQLYRHTKEEFLREPTERAFEHLAELVKAGGCEGTLPSGKPFACVADRGQKVTSLGSTALTVVALAEYARATNDPRYDELAKALTEWILFMQRPDGSFAHLYNVPKAEKDEETELLYFSGEAALALAQMHIVHGDPRYIEATERALDDLVAWYDFFAGGFFVGEEALDMHCIRGGVSGAEARPLPQVLRWLWRLPAASTAARR
jgi:hypothetical protein